MNRSKAVRVIVHFSVIVCVVSPLVLGGEQHTLAEMAFMVGHWAGKAGSIEMEEYWIAPKGGVMLGLHRDAPPGRNAFFEYLRIEDRDGALVYVASPRGGGSTDFFLVTLDDRGAVFENLEHDFPQRIIYRRDGNRLTAKIEGEADGETRSSEWVWELVE